ncbi:MAG: DegT/DnrJ/EryC1/StrS family aminotransferase [Candidatus Omnitrophica bacterium]|nr:DegT/DnrJ/EryC1/StrS family aminotransferase [Candidatus Omnitrophota bacterium]
MEEKLALFGGRPVRQKPYPFYNTIGSKEKESVLEVLNSGLLSGFSARGNAQFLGGKYVRKFEELFGRKFNSKYAVSFNSATSGLHGALVAAGVGPGDEVIVPCYSMSATAAAVLMCYAAPIFVDVEPDMFCLDPDKLPLAITGRTKAIITVNLFGMPSDLASISALARKHDLVLIEDNAQAPGARYHGKFAGTVADMGVFSLNRHKTIQCGEGGVVLTNNKFFAERLQLVRNHGEVILLEWGRDEHADIVGHNYRLSEVHAAIAIAQTGKLDALNKYRIDLAGYLTKMLKNISFLRSPVIRDNCNHVFYLYPMLYDKKALGISRDTLLNALQAEGICVSNYVAPIYHCPLFQKYQRAEEKDFIKRFPGYDSIPDYSPGICKEAELLYEQKIIATPICRQPQLKKDIEQFIGALKKIERNIDELLKYEKA